MWQGRGIIVECRLSPTQDGIQLQSALSTYLSAEYVSMPQINNFLPTYSPPTGVGSDNVHMATHALKAQRRPAG